MVVQCATARPDVAEADVLDRVFCGGELNLLCDPERLSRSSMRRR